ncbi:carboxypeptidase-like regulatory domain-containing protein [Bremerella sp. JC770]|uniref:carboxypeptidase-like regulatory domain-containing protein n=1 Tax=Bremerella sp. JC770 TaxID=3232137 RepID=UPI00345777E3
MFARLMLMVAGLAFCGCGSSGSDVSKVSGTVTFNGQPVNDGIVSFMSDSGFGTSALLGDDGSYQLRSQHGKGIPSGVYKVTVSPMSEDVAESESRTYRAAKRDDIPSKYQNFETSALELRVENGPQVFDIQMKP